MLLQQLHLSCSPNIDSAPGHWISFLSSPCVFSVCIRSQHPTCGVYGSGVEGLHSTTNTAHSNECHGILYVEPQFHHPRSIATLARRSSLMFYDIVYSARSTVLIASVYTVVSIYIRCLCDAMSVIDPPSFCWLAGLLVVCIVSRTSIRPFFRDRDRDRLRTSVAKL